MNPPLFAWKPQVGDRATDLQVSRDAGFTDLVIDLSGLTESLHLPERALSPGTYWWRWCAGGAVSEVFEFHIGEEAVRFEVPSADQWLKSLGTQHPRLHCRPEWLETIRDRACSEQPEATLELLVMADELRTISHEIPEPPFLPDRNKDFEANRRIWFPTMWNTRKFVKGAETLALAYLITGDKAYGRDACERLVSISKWDPDGSTYLGHNDEAHMSVIWHGPHAVDWCWDLFTESERALVIEQYRRRGQITYEHMHDKAAYGIHRFDSHAGREIVFLAMTAFTFHEHIPEAAQWLEWLRPVLNGIWPVWAGDDGGWAQGPSYGLAYVGIQTMYASAIKRGAGVDVYRRPFWRNHARWRRWFVPPYTDMQGFGDQGRRWRSGVMNNADLMEIIGIETGTDEFAGYARALRAQTQFDEEPVERHMLGVSGHLYLARLTKGLVSGDGSAPDGSTGVSKPDAEARPSELTAPIFGDSFDASQSVFRQFPFVGWAAIRSKIETEANGAGDVALLVRSSPFGSVSHSHANNNDFILHVGGTMMAMPSGFYGGVKNGYGGDHHANWVWHTKSHNCVTLSDAGQIMRSTESTGAIANAYEDERLIYFTGIADSSYADRAERCRRHVLFLKSSSAVVLIDEFVGLSQILSTLQWNLHTPAPLVVDETQRTFSWKRGRSQVAGAFLYHDNAFFSITRGCDPPPATAEHEQPYPMQHNLRFTCNMVQAEFLAMRGSRSEAPGIARNLAVVLAPSCPGVRQAKVVTARHGESEEAFINGDRLIV
ncbi:MAG: DUF4962 domain-containing protein, partial [Gemmatimonadetes bacterium]|nr:DUF4962 domain-containing protein [Gemmatimonadota bacterium]